MDRIRPAIVVVEDLLRVRPIDQDDVAGLLLVLDAPGRALEIRLVDCFVVVVAAQRQPIQPDQRCQQEDRDRAGPPSPCGIVGFVRLPEADVQPNQPAPDQQNKRPAQGNGVAFVKVRIAQRQGDHRRQRDQ